MALHTQLLQSCVEEAAEASRAALGRAIDDAMAALQISETQSMKPAEREAIAAACRGLIEHRPAWLAQYPADLLAALEQGLPSAIGSLLQPDGPALATADRTPAARGSNAGSGSGWSGAPQGLSLVDDADVSQAIESSRLLQLMLPAVELPLAELDRLISAAQGLGNVRPELNPLRPEIFTVALRRLVAASSPDGAISALWLRNLAAPLGRELRLIYEKTVNRLELAQVRAVGYRVVQTPAAPARGRAGSTADSGSPGAHGDAAGSVARPAGRSGAGRAPAGYVSDEPLLPPRTTDLSDRSVQHALMNGFLRGDAQDVASHGLTTAYYDDIEEELRALKRERDVPSGQEPKPKPEPESQAQKEAVPTDQAPDDLDASYAELPVVDRPQRVVNERSQLSEKIWGVFGRRKARAQVRVELKKDATRVGQVLGLEAVRQLVNQVAQDARLLAPVREAIVALEPSLLRLAMVDPRFFRDEAHAGRRLMERVAQRSFNFNDEFSAEFLAFLEPVAAAFNQLNGSTDADPQVFAQALARLEQQWAGQDQLAAAQRQAVLQALRFAEERQGVADGIAFELSRRSDLADVPALVLDFLFGPWALVMAQARLIDTRGQIDPQGFGSLVPDLLWSVKRTMTLKKPAKLIEMIPGLLVQLHAGLALLGSDAAQTEAFFDGLMRLHQPVLTLRRTKSQKDSDEPTHASLAADEPAVEVTDALPLDLPATPAQRLVKAAAQPWLARSDREAAGFDETAPSDLTALQPRDASDAGHALADHAASQPAGLAESAAEPATGDPATEPGEIPDAGEPPARAGLAGVRGLGAITPAEAALALTGLQTGMWVDLYARKSWRRAQLVWASANGTLFMFVSHGGQAHSMTRRSCERLIVTRLLRPLPMHGVVEQALDAVAQLTAVQLTSGGAADRRPPA